MWSGSRPLEGERLTCPGERKPWGSYETVVPAVDGGTSSFLLGSSFPRAGAARQRQLGMLREVQTQRRSKHAGIPRALQNSCLSAVELYAQTSYIIQGDEFSAVGECSIARLYFLNFRCGLQQ